MNKIRKILLMIFIGVLLVPGVISESHTESSSSDSFSDKFSSAESSEEKEELCSNNPSQCVENVQPSSNPDAYYQALKKDPSLVKENPEEYESLMQKNSDYIEKDTLNSYLDSEGAPQLNGNIGSLNYEGGSFTTSSSSFTSNELSNLRSKGYSNFRVSENGELQYEGTSRQYKVTGDVKSEDNQISTTGSITVQEDDLTKKVTTEEGNIVVDEDNNVVLKDSGTITTENDNRLDLEKGDMTVREDSYVAGKNTRFKDNSRGINIETNEKSVSYFNDGKYHYGNKNSEGESTGWVSVSEDEITVAPQDEIVVEKNGDRLVEVDSNSANSDFIPGDVRVKELDSNSELLVENGRIKKDLESNSNFPQSTSIITAKGYYYTSNEEGIKDLGKCDLGCRSVVKTITTNRMNFNSEVDQGTVSTILNLPEDQIDSAINAMSEKNVESFLSNIPRSVDESKNLDDAILTILEEGKGKDWIAISALDNHASIDNPELQDKIISIAKDSSRGKSARLKSISALSKIDSERAEDTLVELAVNPNTGSNLRDFEVKREAISELANRGSSSTLSRLVSSSDRDTRLYTIEAVGKNGNEEQVSLLSKGLDDSDSAVRTEAMESIVNLREDDIPVSEFDDDIVDRLASRAEDSEIEIERNKAIEALEALEDNPKASEVLSSIDRESTSSDLKRARKEEINNRQGQEQEPSEYIPSGLEEHISDDDLKERDKNYLEGKNIINRFTYICSSYADKIPEGECDTSQALE